MLKLPTPLLRLVLGAALTAAASSLAHAQHSPPSLPLWDAYARVLKGAKYVDLTHTITPTTPVWVGFGEPTFFRTLNPQTHRPYDYQPDGFASTGYTLLTDQLGTQLDPPAHWSADYPAIDELPPTFAVRPLVVISIVEQLRRAPGYHLQVADVKAWEKAHGPVPEGSVVFVRSDWSKRWPDPKLTQERVFPGVSLAALQYLHQQRHILMHGHEPLDTDTTSGFKAEAWLLRSGYTQAEGVCNLDQVPEAGALVSIGYAKLAGGTGGYARYIAICPAGWKFGVAIDPAKESPLPRQDKPLRWDDRLGRRVR